MYDSFSDGFGYAPLSNYGAVNGSVDLPVYSVASDADIGAGWPGIVTQAEAVTTYDPQAVLINADDRGNGNTYNGKVSLNPTEAGGQITRTGATWATGLGQPTTVTFAFRATAYATAPNGTTGFNTFTQTQINATLQALAAWSEVANITFQRVDDGGGYSDNASMLFSNYTGGADGAAAFAYSPGTRTASSVSGDVLVNNSASQSYNSYPVLMGYGPQVLLHEIGHAIGLRHPADYNASAGVSITYAEHATYFEDSRQYTVMSYFGEENTGAYFRNDAGTRQYAAGPLMDDIAAAQRLYGANMNTRTGDTTYGFNSNAGQAWFSAATFQSDVIFAVWDAGGIDTFDFSGYLEDGVIDLRQGTFSSVGGLIGNVSIAMGVVIENAIGGDGNDTIIGNAADNTLTGGGGNDTINGGLGTDTVVFSGTRASYTVTWNGQVGTVTGNGTTTTVTNVEFLKFSDQTIAAAPTGGLVVSGDITNNTMNGTPLADTLNGLGGDDIINGLAGNDIINGGYGNDTINGGDGADVIDGGYGDDTVDGGLGNDTITGGFGSDNLHGGDGDDVITAGVPTGSAGAPDVVKAQGQVISSIGTALSLNNAFDLQARTGVENATTIPHATVLGTSSGQLEYYAFTVVAGETVRFDIDGASFDSALRLFNGSGTELAANDDASPSDGSPSTDSAFEYTFATAGTYYIQVSAWTGNITGGFLSGPAPAGGTYQLNISIPSATVQTAPAVGSNLYGDAGNDTLYGSTGSDNLYGGVGNDTYHVNGQFDIVFENAGAGTDTVISSADYYLYANIENLTLSGTGNIFGVGNASNNTITGNSGSNLLLGGAGQDTIDGGAGNDNLYGEAGVDVLYGGAGIDYLVGGGDNDLLYGEGDADALYGEDGDDVLWAGDGFVTDILVGGAGNDILRGDSHLADYDLLDGDGGDDIYWVDTGDDLTFEDVGGGNDTVYADVRVANAGVYLYANVENLVLVGTTAFGVGNELNNLMVGSAAANWLLGGAGNDVINGGAGNDVLFGEAGADTFVFKPGSGGDVIGDFTVGTDKIDLKAFGFANFTQLSANFSQNGADGAINLGNGDFIVLHGVTMANLTAADFIFPGQASAGDALSTLLPADDIRFYNGGTGAPDSAPKADADLIPQVLVGADDTVFVSAKESQDLEPQVLITGEADDFLLKSGDDLIPQVLVGADDGFAGVKVFDVYEPQVLVGAELDITGPEVLPGPDDGDHNFTGLDAHLREGPIPDHGFSLGMDDPFLTLSPTAWHF